MIKEGKFGVQEAICLATIAMCNKIFSTTPGYLTRAVGNAGWYMTLISCTMALLAFTFICMLLKRFPGKNIVEIYDASLGKVIGLIFSFTLMGSFLIYTSIYTREFVDFSKVFIFPMTPPSFLIGAFLFVMVISAFLGIETIARVAKLAAFLALFGYMVLMLLSSHNFHSAYIFPILGYGVDKTITTGILRSSAYAEILILAVFASSLQGIKHIKKAGYVSLLLSGFIISIGILFFTMTFAYTSTEEIVVPIYLMVRAIKYGTFFQRLDPVFLFLIVTTTVIYLSILFYTTVSIYCKMFRLQDVRPVIIPMGVLAFTIAIFPRDFPSVISEYVQEVRVYGNITCFVLPLTALIVAVIRKKKGDKSNA